MNQENVITTTISHADALRNSIAQHICPAREDCYALIDDLDALCRLQEQKTEKEADNVNIEALFDDFTQYAESSKTQLESMLSFISGGRVPSAEHIKAFNLTIDNLRDKYASVYHAALDQLPAE